MVQNGRRTRIYKNILHPRHPGHLHRIWLQLKKWSGVWTYSEALPRISHSTAGGGIADLLIICAQIAYYTLHIAPCILYVAHYTLHTLHTLHIAHIADLLIMGAPTLPHIAKQVQSSTPWSPVILQTFINPPNSIIASANEWQMKAPKILLQMGPANIDGEQLLQKYL